ncbi:MAG: FkbM family methyltransferase [Planctomycetota bacterium]|nr:FkbM family methyltransferase [Planctomycetota bacterium]
MDYDEEYFLRQFVRSGMTVLDVGANIGYISLICGRRVAPGGRVHCFEPLSANFSYLQRNLMANGLGDIVIANQSAVTAEAGQTVNLDYCQVHSGLTCLSVGEDNNGQHWKRGYEQVSTVALDDYVIQHDIRRVDLLKIDIEGAELLALRGAERLISQHKPVVVCEFNDPALRRLGGSAGELWAFWRTHGYEFCRYVHRTRTLWPCQMPREGHTVTYIGATDGPALARQLGASVRQWGSGEE